MLVAAAAQRWNVTPEQCRTERSVVHGPNGQSAPYAELAGGAAQKPIPASVRLKNPSEFRLVGNKVRRLDGRPKCDGSLKFGLDLDLPGMQVAVVAPARVRRAGQKLRRQGGAEPRRRARCLRDSRGTWRDGVAVVADKFWPAKQGRDRLQIEWDFSGVERADSSQLWTRYKELARTTGNVAVARGDARAIESIAAASRIVAEYAFPYLAHTPMEPLNTTVRFDGDRAEVWAGSQFQTIDQAAIAEVLGLQPEQVTFHRDGRRGFGLRATPDARPARGRRDCEAPARSPGQVDLVTRRRRAGRLLPPHAPAPGRDRHRGGRPASGVATRDRGPVPPGRRLSP